MSSKEKAAFKDLGASVMAAASETLGASTIVNHRRFR
jgi:hypothetical protein